MQWTLISAFVTVGRSGVADPLFGVDLGFYFFRLPFYDLLQGSLTILTVAALAILGVVSSSDWGSTSPAKNALADKTSRHLVVLLFMWPPIRVGFYLDHYELVYSTLGVVYGAGYAAAHVTRFALWGMVGCLGSGMCASRSYFFSVRVLKRWLRALVSMWCCT